MIFAELYLTEIVDKKFRMYRIWPETLYILVTLSLWKTINNGTPFQILTVFLYFVLENNKSIKTLYLTSNVTTITEVWSTRDRLFAGTWCSLVSVTITITMRYL